MKTLQIFAEEIVAMIDAESAKQMSEEQLQIIEDNLLDDMRENFLQRPTEYDYDEMSTGEIRDALHFLETGEHPMLYLQEAIVDALQKSLLAALEERERRTR